MHARAKRKRSRAAVLTGKRDDILACLHGAVNGGAEKEKDREHLEKFSECSRSLFLWAALRLAAFACPLYFRRFTPDMRILQHFRLWPVLLSDLWFSDAL
jgi:hypothetical protein